MTTEPHLLDLNVLIALAWPQHVHHARAHAWFESLTSPWMTTPVTEAGFVRLSTNRAVVTEAVSMATALAMLSAMRAVPGHTFLPDDSGLAAPVIALDALATSSQVTDAHLVNLAASSGAVLATLDRGIERILCAADRRHVSLLP
ncbi:MAG: TA system VapC family ribonuclease toxin [Pseudolysinimonas sp.]